jgi:hypothetical protein
MDLRRVRAARAGDRVTAYVDALQPHEWRGRTVLWCHLIADSLQELHAFAEAIGCKRSWFQNAVSCPHYDLQSGLREKAVRAGALELGRAEFVTKMRALREACGRRRR